MCHKLVEIPTIQWPDLRDMYIKRKDRASCYNTIQTFINWKNKEPKMSLKIYSLNGNWKDGTFVAKVRTNENKIIQYIRVSYNLLQFLNQVFFNTFDENLQRLLEALNCLGSSETYLLAGYQDSVVPAVKQHFMDSGLEKDQYQPTTTLWYHVPKEQALKFSIV